MQKIKEPKSNYCITHTCKKCKKLNQSKYKYCDSCRCPFEQCIECKKDYSNYCHLHSCKYKYCKDPVTSKMDGGKRKATSTFCVSHKCRIDGCKQQIKRDNYIYCGSHNCRSGTCKNPCLKNKYYCAAHCTPKNS